MVQHDDEIDILVGQFSFDSNFVVHRITFLFRYPHMSYSLRGASSRGNAGAVVSRWTNIGAD